MSRTNVFITGGSRGIGAALVRRFVAGECRVGYNFLNSMRDAMRLAEQTGAFLYRADVVDQAELAEAIGSFGHVDVLIANAGIAHYALFQETTNADWRRIFEINFFGVVNAVNAVLPEMLARKSGTIVIISSIWGDEGASFESAYAASKGALNALARSLEAELAPSNIRVILVTPSLVLTEMNGHLSPEEIAEFCRERGERPQRTESLADEIFYDVLFSEVTEI